MEMIDIYDENHIYLGNCEKSLAHKLGLWHDIFTCLIINKDKRTVFLQIKNHKHNSIHNKDLIEITVGGHYKSGEKIEDGVREINEETGLDVNFKELISLGTRQVSLTINKNYIIREFQYMILYSADKELEDFKNFDDEVVSFIEFNIDELIELLLYKKDNIKGKTINGIKNINLSNFVESYLNNDKLYLRFLIAAKRYISGENKELIFWQ